MKAAQKRRKLLASTSPQSKQKKVDSPPKKAETSKKADSPKKKATPKKRPAPKDRTNTPTSGSKVPSKSRNISSGSAEALGGPSCPEGSSTFSEKDSQLNTSSPTSYPKESTSSAESQSEAVKTFESLSDALKDEIVSTKASVFKLDSLPSSSGPQIAELGTSAWTSISWPFNEALFLQNKKTSQVHGEPPQPQNLSLPSTTSAQLPASSTVAEGRQEIRMASNQIASNLINGKSVLCGSCGFISQDLNNCGRCLKPIDKMSFEKDKVNPAQSSEKQTGSASQTLRVQDPVNSDSMEKCGLCCRSIDIQCTIEELFGNISTKVALEYIHSLGKTGSKDTFICSEWCFLVLENHLKKVKTDIMQTKVKVGLNTISPDDLPLWEEFLRKDAYQNEKKSEPGAQQTRVHQLEEELKMLQTKVSGEDIQTLTISNQILKDENLAKDKMEAELQQQIKSQAKAHTELKVELARIKRENVQLKTDLTAVRSSKEKEKDDLTRQISRLQFELSDRARNQDNLEKELSSARKQTDRLSSELNHVKKENKRLEQLNNCEQLATITIENKEMKERMDRMLIQLRETEDELNETLKNYMTLFDGSKDLSEDEKLKHYHEVLKSDLASKRLACKQILQEKFQQSKNFGKVFEEKKEMEVHLSKLHQENVFLKESLDKFDEEIKTSRASINAEFRTEGENLKKKIREKEDTIQNLKVRISVQSKRIAEIEAKENEKSKMKSAFKEEIKLLKDQHAEELQTAKEAEQRLTSELRKTFESKFLIIENRLISLATDFFETLGELSDDESSLLPEDCQIPKDSSNLEDYIITLENLLTHASERLQVMQDHCKSLNFKLQNASSSSESQAKEIEKAVQGLKKKNQELETELKLIKNKLEESMRESTLHKSNLEELEKEIGSLKHELASKRQSAETDAKVIKALESSHNESKRRDQERIRELEAKISKLEMSREKLNSDFKNQEEAIKSSNNKLKEKISELEVKTTELENSLDFKNRLLGELETKIEESKEEQTNQEKKIQQLTTKLETETARAEKAKATLTSVLLNSTVPNKPFVPPSNSSSTVTTSAPLSRPANPLSQQTVASATTSKPLSQVSSGNLDVPRLTTTATASKPSVLPSQFSSGNLGDPRVTTTAIVPPSQVSSDNLGAPRVTTTAIASKPSVPPSQVSSGNLVVPRVIHSAPVTNPSAGPIPPATQSLYQPAPISQTPIQLPRSSATLSTAQPAMPVQSASSPSRSSQEEQTSEVKPAEALKLLFERCMALLDPSQQAFCQRVLNSYKTQLGKANRDHLLNIDMNFLEAIQKKGEADSQIHGYEIFLKLIFCKAMWESSDLLPPLCIKEVMASIEVFLQSRVPKATFRVVPGPR